MAPCHDKITNSVIKDALPYILPVLTDIVNRSLLSTVFSSDATPSGIEGLQTNSPESIDHVHEQQKEAYRTAEVVIRSCIHVELSLL